MDVYLKKLKDELRFLI